MANNKVSVDTVYQKVLALANKEQRGYITPQEFNLFADQAQQELFEDYFHNIKIAKLKPTNNTEASDEIDMLNERISIHKVIDAQMTVSSGVHTYSDAVYKLTSVYTGTNGYEVKEVENSDIRDILVNSLSNPRASTPVYTRVGPNKIKIYPTATYSSTANIKYEYIKKPEKPNWTYVVIGGKALYNSSGSGHADFDLHESEESNLVMRILELSGITLSKPELTQVAMRDKANTEAKKNN
jgi:hypothetical protein